MSPDETYGAALSRLADGDITIVSLIADAENLAACGRRDLASALYRQAIERGIPAGFLHALWYNLAVLLDQDGDLAGALAAFQASLQIHPDLIPANLYYGQCLAKAGDVDGAIERWRHVLAILGTVTTGNIDYRKAALGYIAYHQDNLRRYAEAERSLEDSLSLDTHQLDALRHWVAMRQQRCAWPAIRPAFGLGQADIVRRLMPLSIAAYVDDPLLLLASGWNFGRQSRVAAAPLSHAERRVPKDKLRIGYLSSDLRSHAVGYLMPEVFERHDRSRFEVVAYYTGPRGRDRFTDRLRAAADRWVDVDADDRVAIERIAADGIDILVDLNGYTRDARLPILAARPAPVIVNWLGYPGTMGSPCHHYIIADDWIVPSSHELYYSEKVVRLPCYQPNDTSRVAAEDERRREDFGLPAEGTVYCCFNSEHKITPKVFAAWMGILANVPGSVLWLFETSADSRANLIAAAQQRGIDPGRLVFAGKLPNPQHLARYRLADLFLDTFPYGAHTTASDALWMGLPVLTLSGRSFASRVCGSLVRAAGAPELVCSTLDEYVGKAVELGRDGQRMAGIKAQLAVQRAECVLFDMAGLVRSLEGLYQDMWADFVADSLPVPDLHNLDAYLDVGAALDFDQVECLGMEDYHRQYARGLAGYDCWRPLVPDRRVLGAPQRPRKTRSRRRADPAAAHGKDAQS